jgi:hypothetical protein
VGALIGSSCHDRASGKSDVEITVVLPSPDMPQSPEKGVTRRALILSLMHWEQESEVERTKAAASTGRMRKQRCACRPSTGGTGDPQPPQARCPGTRGNDALG